MKDIYDLTSILSLNDFPWIEVQNGLIESENFPSGFYGIKKDGTMGYTVSLTVQKNSGPYRWYMLEISEEWVDHENKKNFPLLCQWIKNSNIFKNTGRIIFFVQPPNISTPAHIDEDLSRAPTEYQKPREFIWLTHPDTGKQLFVNNTPAPYACWFNSYTLHSSTPSEIITWSLRIDGNFTDNFKKLIGYEIL